MQMFTQKLKHYSFTIMGPKIVFFIYYFCPDNNTLDNSETFKCKC